MNVADTFRSLRRIHVPAKGPPVLATVAKEVRAELAPEAEIRTGGSASRPVARSLVLRIEAAKRPRVTFTAGAGERLRLVASGPEYLYAAFRWLVETRGDDPASRYRSGRRIGPAFRTERPVFDHYFAQAGRTVEGLDREMYVREMARGGFTHLEVNSLAFPEPLEPGVPGEVYPRFYTYCPALDQFVSSLLTGGLYPPGYLAANLARLRDGAELAVRYGLVPSLTCFEPRSVPDELLDRYPELRGCRVDHPFRSFKPRYNLALSHPVVRRHYRELVTNLLRSVPALGFLSVWTNDSGAGLEFTRSLYAGANGSAYLVREWSEEDVFARAAAKNATDFLHLLRDAAAEVNPGFRVATRLEPFGPERAHVLAALGDGVDVEAPTLLATGWDSPYGHPEYEDSGIGPFTVFNNSFRGEEKNEISRLARRGIRTHVHHARGPVNDFEPLLGIPTPWLVYEKLRALRAGGARDLAHIGGIAPPSAVPFPVNEEVFRRFQHDPGRPVERVVREIAEAFAGRAEADSLVEAWRGIEAGIRAFHPNPLYFLWGVWYRIEVRPLVPDVEAIPEAERAYYERHLLSTHHNPNRVDLARDVLFTLMTPETARKAVERNDRRALPAVAAARDRLRCRCDELPADAPGRAALADLAERAAALLCWMTTRRHVSAWIADVHGYLATRDRRRRAACRRRLQAMVESEIENAREWLRLVRESPVRFMAVSGNEETTFLYGRSFADHLEQKITLMTRYGDRAPRIDESILWRVRHLPDSTQA